MGRIRSCAQGLVHEHEQRHEEGGQGDALQFGIQRGRVRATPNVDGVTGVQQRQQGVPHGASPDPFGLGGIEEQGQCRPPKAKDDQVVKFGPLKSQANHEGVFAGQGVGSVIAEVVEVEDRDAHAS